MRRVLFFVGLLLVLDQVIGLSLDLVSARVRSGMSYGIVNAALAAAPTAEVVFLGSSTTVYHYDPRVIAPKLGLQVFNAGVSGRDYDYVYSIMRLMAKRGEPKLWVLTLDAERIVLPSATADILAPRMDEDPAVRRLVMQSATNKVEQLRYLSRTMRYNGRALGMVWQLLSPSATEAGYIPLQGEMPEGVATSIDPSLGTREPSARQLELLKEIVLFAREQGSMVVFVLAPVHDPSDSRKALQEVNLQLAREMQVPLLDYREHPAGLVSNPSFFRDPTHLNEAGSRLLSTLVAEDLSKLLNAK